MNQFRNYSIVVSAITLGATLFGPSIDAQSRRSDSAAVVAAIVTGSEYAIRVLLDEEGKSRCDYVISDGVWQPYEPAWHTGQIINALVESYRITRTEHTLRAARRAGNWWTRLEITDHPTLRGMTRAIHGAGIEAIVFSTVTDGTAGLFNLYRETGVKMYAEVPTKAGAWMLRNLESPEAGLFYDMVDPVTGRIMKDRSLFWTDKSAQSLTDVARPNSEGSLFKEMYEFTGDETYRAAFLRQCDALVARQGPEGLWMEFTPNDAADGSIHPRYNLWNAESLIEAFVLTGRESYRESAVKTLRFYAELFRRDGTIYYDSYVNGPSRKESVAGSAVAFMGLLLIRLESMGFRSEFESVVESCAAWVLKNRFHAAHPDPNLAGAFLDLKTRMKGGRVQIVQRDVGTPFALRFLANYYRSRFAPA